MDDFGAPSPPQNKPGRSPMMWAVVSILATGCCLLIVPALLLPALAQGRELKRASDCRLYLRQIGGALDMYTADFDGHYPTAEWMDALGGRMPREKFLHCPSVDPEYGYALNAEVVGMEREKIEDPKTPLVFDSNIPGRNAVGGIESMPKPERHLHQNNVLQVGGAIEATPPKS